MTEKPCEIDREFVPWETRFRQAEDELVANENHHHSFGSVPHRDKASFQYLSELIRPFRDLWYVLVAERVHHNDTKAALLAFRWIGTIRCTFCGAGYSVTPPYSIAYPVICPNLNCNKVLVQEAKK